MKARCEAPSEQETLFEWVLNRGSLTPDDRLTCRVAAPDL